jgi:hypothetical protein
MSFPRYPDWKPLSLEDRSLFETFLNWDRAGACEMCFANVLIWRGSEHPKVTLVNDNLCVLVEPTFEPSYFLQPLGETDMEGTIRTCLGLAPRLSRLPEEFVRRYGGPFKVEENRNNFDYVYRTEDLAELRGKKFDGKRNRIRKFESLGSFAYERLRPEHRGGCRRLLEEWYADKGDGDSYIQAQRQAILEALDSFEDLGLTGGVVTVSGRVEAFTIGQGLTGDMALIQIEIANPALPGLAQWINREFVRREWTSYAFINREQDLGLEGLRRAKLSYQPVRLLKKYDLFF